MSLWEELGLDALDAQKVNFIRSGIVKKMSGNAIQKALRASPLGGMRRGKLQKIIRKIKGTRISRPYIKSVNLNKRIDFSRFKESPYNHEKKYNFVIKISGISKQTGQRDEQWITISTDNRMTKEEAMFEAGIFIGTGKYKIAEGSAGAEIDEILLGSNYYEE